MISDQENSFLNAVLILQSTNERIETRINALRHLKHYVETNPVIDVYNRRRINQLIIDNVMKVILDSSNEVDSFKRQLIRVELFVLLSQILRSNSLFGAELTESVAKELHNYQPLAFQSGSLFSSNDNSVHSSVSDNYYESERMQAFQSRQTVRINKDLSKSVILFPTKKRLKTAHEPGEQTQYFSKSLKNKENEFSLIKTSLSEKRPKIELNTRLKPRPSVLFDDKLHTDNFVPGADPKNFLEQDRKLGYQKPRMWFPIPQLDLASSLMQPKSHKSEANQIVEEYMKMKSIATYVGDLIVPPGSVSHSKKAVVDSKRYSSALTEAMMMWTPILNTRVKQLSTANQKKRKISYLAPYEEDEVEQGIGSPPPRSFYEESVGFDSTLNTSLTTAPSLYESNSVNEYNQFAK
jgi:hypothetical protein